MKASIDTDGKMLVEYEGVTKKFDTYKGLDGIAADYVFASPVVRRGKDWPVSVIITPDGRTLFRRHIISDRPRSISIHVTGFWADSQNKSESNGI